MTFNEVILGNAPFIGATRFGHRSRLYELDFKKQPENIAKIMNKSNEMGVKNILIKNNKDVVDAVKLSESEGFDWNVIGITDCTNFDDDLKIFEDLSANTILLSDKFVDSHIKDDKFDDIANYLNKINDMNKIAGLESNLAFHNTPLIYNSFLMDLFDVYMIPLNFYGYMLDCDYFKKENKEIYKENISKMNKKIIANHTLATGILKPAEAYEYIKNIDFIDSVCVGVAKTEEAEETFDVINKYI